MKFHVNKNGEVRVCRAVEKPCPLGSANEHFKTREEAQEHAYKIMSKKYDLKGGIDFESIDVDTLQSTLMGMSDSELQDAETSINELIPTLKGIASVRMKRKGQMIEYAKRGLNYNDELEKQKKEVEAKIRIEEENLERAYKAFANEKYLEFPSGSEYLLSTDKYSRYNLKSYRGEVDPTAESNSGVAMYGSGIYTTTNRSYAKKFGKVSTVEPEAMPSNPIRFKDALAFSQFEHDLATKYNIKRKDLYREMEVEDLIIKLGYDGVTIGPKSDMILVMFDTDRNKHKFK